MWLSTALAVTGGQGQGPRTPQATRVVLFHLHVAIAIATRRREHLYKMLIPPSNGDPGIHLINKGKTRPINQSRILILPICLLFFEMCWFVSILYWGQVDFESLLPRVRVVTESRV